MSEAAGRVPGIDLRVPSADPLAAPEFPVDQSKLLIPAVPSYAVPRPSLVRVLQQATHRRLTLLIAPPGSGKSVLLGQWAASRPSTRLAWLTVDPADGDAVRFAHHLVAALGAASPGLGLSAIERLEHTGLAMGHQFSGALLSEAADFADTTLVIDDFGRLPNAAIVEEIGGLVERLPPTLHLVLAARADPGFPLGRLRTLDEVVELRQEQLAMSPEQGGTLVERVAQRSMTPAQRDLLHRKTEGWAAGLHLAALSLRRRSDVDEFLATFAGNDRTVADYLTEEVLQRQPERVQRFLLQTAVLEHLTAPLCDAVTGGTGSQEVLEQLDRHNMFVFRLDNTREGYRYHRLFQDLLRSRLRALDPELERTMLLRAAEWYAEEGSVEQVARYLVAARAWDRLREHVETHARSLFEQGRAGVAARWLDAVPADEAGFSTREVLARAWLHTASGSALVADQELVELERVASLTVGEAAVQLAFRSAGAQWHAEPSRVIAMADDALARLSAADEASVPDVLGGTSPDDVRVIAEGSRARALAYQGEVAAARDGFEAIEAQFRAGRGRLVWRVHVSGSRALLEAWSGNLQLARSWAGRALDDALEADLRGQGATADAYLAMAVVARERNELAEAEHFLEEGLVHASINRRHVLLAIHAAEQALTALARDDPENGLAALERYTASGHPPPPPAVADRLQAARVRLLLACGDGPAALDLVAWRQPRLPALAAAAMTAAVTCERLDLAREELETWKPSEFRGVLERDIWSAVLADVDGHRSKAVAAMADVVSRADREGHVRLFLDGGAPVLRLVRAVHHSRPSGFVRSLLEPAALHEVRRDVEPLVETLSDRESIVLGYLPTRKSNEQIARQLYISVNTLKTHLRRIYRKLGVAGRNVAVARAEDLGLF